MKTSTGRLALVFILMALACGALAQTRLERARLVPGDLAWVAGANGVSRVVIAGSNETAGLYAYRARFPRGFKNEPHFHPDDRVVTVISGTLHMGYGEKFDESAMRALPPGSVWTEPANTPHFVWAQDGEVVIQVIGVGPSGTTQVNP
jgi:quercetin dioxygenase-like cupin family protein